MKKIFLILFLVILSATLFANTLLETSLSGYDPYLADRDGFDSLFMNPAGMAGDTQYFTLSADAGTWGELDNYKLLADNIERLREIFPEARAQEAMGITGFTLPTMYRWVRSDLGREMSLHPFQNGHFLGSGQGHVVLAEAGLDGESQYQAIRRYLDAKARAK